MRKLKGSAAEKVLKKAGGVLGDKGFIGTGYNAHHPRRTASADPETILNGRDGRAAQAGAVSPGWPRERTRRPER
jgi:hypothetical protein